MTSRNAAVEREYIGPPLLAWADFCLVLSHKMNAPLLLVLNPSAFHLISLGGIPLSMERQNVSLVERMRRGGPCLGDLIRLIQAIIVSDTWNAASMKRQVIYKNRHVITRTRLKTYVQ